MAVIKLNRELQIWTGLYCEDLTDPKKKMYKLVMNFLYITVMFLIMVVASFVYILHNFSDLKTTTNSIIVLMAGCSGIACYWSLTTNVEHSKKLYRDLEEIVDESKKKNIVKIIVLF